MDVIVVRFLLATAIFPFFYFVHVGAWSMFGIALMLVMSVAPMLLCRWIWTGDEEHLSDLKESWFVLYVILLWPFEIWYKIVFFNEYPKNYSS